jgi:hypothetical protein
MAAPPEIAADIYDWLVTRGLITSEQAEAERAKAREQQAREMQQLREGDAWFDIAHG